MFPTNSGVPLDIMPVKKRRSRKKKDVVVDPEAERQERELRMKIKQSLHTQQVLRTEVEDEEHQRSLKVNAHLRGGGVNDVGPDARPAGPSANNIGNCQTINPLMMGSGVAMGFSGVQPQMGGMGVQHQQQHNFQFNARNQQFGYGDQGASSDMGGTRIPSMQQQMRQMEQQLEMQQQHLDHQIKLKQQLGMQHPLQQRQKLQSPLYPRNESSLKFGRETKFSSEEIMRSLQYEQERLLEEARQRDIVNNKASEASGSQAPITENVPPVKQEQAKYQHDENYEVGSPQQNRRNITSTRSEKRRPQSADSSPSPECLPVPGTHQEDSNFHRVSRVPKLYKQDGSGMSHGNSSNQKTNINQHGLPNNYQNHLVQNQYLSQSHSIQHQDAVPHIQDDNQQYCSPVGSQSKEKSVVVPQTLGNRNSQDTSGSRASSSASMSESWMEAGSINLSSLSNSMAFHSVGNMSASFSSTMPMMQKSTTTRPPGHKHSQETQGKSVSSSNPPAESWLKADSMGSSSLSNSMAFHSVGNMSASFGSAMEGDMGQTAFTSSVQKNIPNDVVWGNDIGGNSRRNDVKLKQTTEEHSNVSCVRATIVRQSGKCNDNDTCSPSIGKGTTYTETNGALQPIQENEADDVSSPNKFVQSSIMMSFLEGEFMKSIRESNLSEANDNASSMSLNDFVMSMDSTTLEALMKKSGGDTNFSIADLTDSILGANNTRENFTTAQTQEQLMLKATDESSHVFKCTKLNHDNKQGYVDSLGRLSQNSIRLKSGDSKFSTPSSLHIDEHNQQKQLQPRLSRNSVKSAVRSRASRTSAVSKISMMSEISQWTKNNPFDNSSCNADSIAAGDGACNSGSAEKKRGTQLESNLRDTCPVDMGDFHSLGGSIDNSLDISMMSSMTGEGLSESIRALDLSARSSARSIEKRGKWS